MRRVCEEYDCYINDYRPFKIALSHRERYEGLAVTIDHVKSKGKFLHVVQILWQ